MTARRQGAPEPATEAILRHWREAVPDDRLAHLVRDAARGLTRALQLRLAEHSVSFGHWIFLRVLWERDGITQRDLSEEAGLMEPTTHSALQRMEELGYIERRQLAGNRKKLFIFLTARGKALRDVLVPLAEEVNRVALGDTSPQLIEATRRTLLAMIQNLADDEARALDGGRRMPSTRDLGRGGTTGARSKG
jgi:MarR family transcriptional regulator, organic hydroperoxide resistance regulator